MPCCTKRHTHSCSAIGWRATVSQVASGNPAKNPTMWSLRACAGTGCGVPGSLYVPSGAKVATHASRSPRFQASTYSLTICGTSTPITSFCSGLGVVCQSLGACAPRPVGQFPRSRSPHERASRPRLSGRQARGGVPNRARQRNHFRSTSTSSSSASNCRRIPLAAFQTLLGLSANKVPPTYPHIQEWAPGQRSKPDKHECVMRRILLQLPSCYHVPRRLSAVTQCG